MRISPTSCARTCMQLSDASATVLLVLFQGVICSHSMVELESYFDGDEVGDEVGEGEGPKYSPSVLVACAMIPFQLFTGWFTLYN